MQEQQNNIVAISFERGRDAYEALAALEKDAADGKIELIAAELLERDAFNRLTSPQVVDTHSGERAIGGTLLGMFVGLLGGPVGMLVGLGAGAVLGGVAEYRRVQDRDELFAQYSRAVAPEKTTILAQVVEPSTEVIEERAARYKGVVLRRSSWDVLAVVEAAKDATEEAEKAAREVLSGAKREKNGQDLDEATARVAAQLSIGYDTD